MERNFQIHPKFIGLENFKKFVQWFFRFPAEPDLYRQVYHCFHDLGKYPCTGNRSSSCTEDSGCECNEEYVLHSVYHEYDNRRFHLEIHFSQGFAALFEKTHLGFLNLSWLGDSHLAFYAVAFVGIWQALGFYIVLYIAGLQAVPTDVLEAAEVDGATSWKKFFKVTLPLLGPSITTCVFMSLTNAVKVFDIILALTKGGPGGSTYSVTLDIYREAFQNNNYGLGSAKALVFFVIILVITQLVLKAMHSREVDL